MRQRTYVITQLIKMMVKPLSANKMYLGRKRKSHWYRDFEAALLKSLPSTGVRIPRKAKIKVTYVVGYSSKLADIDNFLKPFQDILQTHYKFNDNRIYKTEIIKDADCNKGEEYIAFAIGMYTEKEYKQDKLLLSNTVSKEIICE